MLCERPLEKSGLTFTKYELVYAPNFCLTRNAWEKSTSYSINHEQCKKTVSLRHEFVCLLIFITILRAHPLYELQVPPAITKYSPSGTTRLLPSLHVFVSSIQQVVLKLSTIIYAAKKRPYKRGVVITYISANHLTSRDTSRR